MSSKFDIQWQIVRTQARDIKDPEKKVDFVLEFLFDHPNIPNKERVLNWLRMTSVAYPDPETKEIFKDAQDYIRENSQKFTRGDNTTKISDVSDKDLLMVYKDLSKRKYGFQFKKVPEAHTQFMKRLEVEMGKRGL